MPLSQLPALLATAFADVAHWLQKRSAARLPLILTGILFARGRRTVTSWFRAAGITDDFRNALEQTNKDVKEVWGAGQQQVRNLHSNEGCFNLNLWTYSLVEAWAWDKPEEDLVDRSDSPWDSEPRRPSHRDKRKALQRDVLHAEIDAALSGQPTKEDFRCLAERLVELAA
jgi:hypothetical protein